MLIILLLAFAGLLWLTHRFSILLSLPIETSVKSLCLPIPKIPLISVDKISSTSIIIHWIKQSHDGLNTENYGGTSTTPIISAKSDTKREPSLKELQTLNSSINDDSVLSSNIAHYLLYINGIETAVINGNLNKCILEDLIPDTNYQIDLVPFNVAGFRSRSIPVYIKTSSTQINAITNDNMDSFIFSLVNNNEQRISQSKKVKLINDQNNENDEKFIKYIENLKNINPHLIEDVNELKWLLIATLEDSNDLFKSINELRNEIKDEEMNLISTRDQAKERRKIEDNNRTSLRQEIKLLEEQRVKGSNRITLDEKKINETRKKIDSLNSAMNEWNLEIEKMKIKTKLNAKEYPQKLNKLTAEINELNKEIFSLFSEVESFETDIKDEINNRKNLETVKVKIFKLFENINNHSDKNTGLLDKEGLEHLDELFKLRPAWKKELLNEIVTIDEKAESDYKLLQKSEFEKFNKMKTKYEENKKRNTPLSVNMNIKSSSSDTTTATNKTNANGYFYNSLTSPDSTSSINVFNNINNSNTNNNASANNSIRNIIRPRISTAGSFHGSEEFNNSNNTNNNNPWSINLSMDSHDQTNLNNGPTSVNMLLPQNLIDGGDLDLMFETQSKKSLLSPNLSGVQLPMMPPTSAQSVLSSSPNLSQINGFDVYQNNLNGMMINSTPQHNTVTSLSLLTSNPLQQKQQQQQQQHNHHNHKLQQPVSTPQPSLAPITSSSQSGLLIGSPQSMQTHLDSNMIDLTHAAITSPFHSNNDLNPVSLLLNNNANTKNNSNNNGNANSNNFFESFNTKATNNSSNLDSLLPDTRGRSTSFGSSIWSNGNTGPMHNVHSATWGPSSSTGKNNDFSFLGAPISMTSTNPLNDNNNDKMVLNNGSLETKDSIFRQLTNESMHTRNHSQNINIESVNHDYASTSPSFIKSVIGKFGASPTKTLSNNAVTEIEFEDSVDEKIIRRKDTGESSNHSSKNLGFGSSRFFKLSRKNSLISNSQHSGITNGSNDGSVSIEEEVTVGNTGTTESNVSNSTNGSGFMGRKLSFAFKRDKNDRIEKNE